MANLGASLVSAKNEPTLAVEMLEGAFGIAVDLGDWRLQYLARSHLPDALALTERPEEALKMAQSLHMDAAKIGYTKFEIDALKTIVELQLAQGEVVAVEDSFKSMLRIAQDRDDQAGQLRALNGRAQVELHKGGREAAIRLLDDSLGMATHPREKAHIAWGLGSLLLTSGSRDRAVTLMRQAIEYYASINHEGLDAMRNRLTKQH
jgi:tetratricopeptide (TPR) repeat protein